ncbi:RsmE family RNA methyltransferase [Moheibacter sediminis]|uniref:Ribosomal RNA small subunit methyltransferase E n=1 Tax=Moheibacter sediminis TaxID=1434700 RepID=A0A1W2AE44_9FLAO|nr:RsmE family RNA methyltransferase [Moheibacter sediminis]SMC58894.1 16S rRNA (uracil1498-N3)-methyltransferase [Moheibacter sediminis]
MRLYIGNINGNFAELNSEESQHFSKVLRGKIGQEIYVTDGLGKLAKGKVSQINSKSIEVELSEIQENFEQRPYQIHVAIAPTKNMERIEFFMEKSVEIGIDEITFLKTFHSERKNINLERCQKIVHSAVKQSLKASVPKINDLIKFSDFLKFNHPENKMIAHCDSNFERKEFKKIIKPVTDYLILIGPEGDFSKEEIQLAEQNGFIGISLGNQRLRTETAALNSVFGLNWMNN